MIGERSIATLIMTVATCGCASVPESIINSPSEAAPVADIQPTARVPEKGCREPVHQPFPTDGSGLVVDQEPEALVRVAPSYPDEARERGVDGLVRLRALICEHGRVLNTVVTNSIPLLDEAARNAVAQWQYRPALRGGHPVATWVDVPVRFSIH